MGGLLKYLFILLLLISFQQVNAQFRLIMEMAVTDQGKKMAGAEIKVFKNGSLVEMVLTDGKGLADIPCDPNAIYTIEVGGNKGMIKKKIEINTNGVAPEVAKGDLFFPATVELFEKIEGMDVSILDKPIGKIKFNEDYGFESDADYTKSVQRQLADLKKDFISKKEADQAKKAASMKQYAEAIKIADKAFSSEEWEKAAEQYRIAEKINPDPLETYPSFQLAELKTKLIKIEADNKRYNEAIGKADAALASKDFEIAIAEYKRASGYKPNEAYPQTKIKEVQGQLVNFAKVKQSYIAAVEKGDNSLKINDLTTAKVAFEEAAGLKPDESYPKNKLAQINDILSKQEAKKAEYDNSIKAADEALAAKNYEAAKTSYQRASSFKPTEQYPKDQIGRVDALIARAVKLNQEYKAAVEKGDNTLTSKNYQEAKTAFETASKLRPSEAYPKEKIKEIIDFIAKNEAAEKEYKIKIDEADKAFAAKQYIDAKAAYTIAKTLKPADSYPIEKVSEIDGILANLSKVEENYKTTIAKGDAALSSKDMEGAKAAFNEALTLKSDEQYPKDKLAEIETIVLKNQKSEEEYKTAVQNGDDALADKNYDKAKEFFNTASGIKPQEAYPKNKIAEIEKTLAAVAEKENAYNEAIVEGDKAMTSKELEKAKASYSKASSLKPDEDYPKDQLAKIETQLVANKELETNYKSAITEGDNAFSSKEYEKAKSAYKKAGDLKTQEEYPTSKLVEIDAIITDLKGKEESYNAAIKKGDDALRSEDYEAARLVFEEALALKDEEYPKGKIKEIKAKIKAIAAAKAANEKSHTDYQSAISKGDQLGADSKFDEAISSYTQASQLKPDEAYPKEQIETVKTAKENAAKEAALAEVQKQYDEKIATADKAFKSGDLEDARTSYQTAASLKVEESYPKEKIQSINATLSHVAETDQHYKDAIGAANKLMIEEKWEEAKVKYNEALTLKPDQEFPKEKIKEIDGRLAKLAVEQEEIRLQNDKNAETEENFSAAIAEADKLFDAEKFEEAMPKYESALVIKEEQYPKDKIKEIGLKLSSRAEQEAAAAAQLKIDTEYDALILAADGLFESNEFGKAKAKYTAALAVKDEQYPKDKIAEVDAALIALAGEEAAKVAAAAQAEVDSKYDALVAEADELFKSDKFKNAKSKYIASIAVKDEQYPKDKIVEADAKLLALAGEETAKAAAAAQAKINPEYDALIAEADASFDQKDYKQAKGSYEAALSLKEEQYPKNQIKKIATADASLANAAKLNQDYLSALKKGDKSLVSNDLENALKSFQAAQNFKPEESYPPQKIAEIDGLITQRAAVNEAAQAELNSTYDAFVQAGQTAMDVKEWKKATSNYEQAKKTLPNKELPATKIQEIIDIQKTLAAKEEEIRLRKEQELAEEERRKALDKPIAIQTGPKSTITTNAEEEIERIYNELWAKQNSEKNATIVEKEEVLAKIRQENLEKEESRRQNAMERLEEISVSLKDQFEISSEMNLQNYEVVKEQGSDIQNTSEERVKASERKREGNMLDQYLLSESIALYNKERLEETVEGKKEMVENEYNEVNQSLQNRDKKQEKYILDTQKKFEDFENRLMSFHQGRSTEFYPKNYEEILADKEDFDEKTTDDKKSSENRRLDYQSKADQKSTELKQFAGKNAESFKENQLEIETLEEELAEQTNELEKESEIRRKKNEDEEFYRGEKKDRQDQSAADYPQGVTEKVIENQNNSTTIRRIAVEGTQTDIYEKTLYKWGGIFYTKNGTNITEDIWDKESR